MGRVLYEDGDEEDFSRDQVIEHMTRSAKEKWLDEDSDSLPKLLGSSEEDIPSDTADSDWVETDGGEGDETSGESDEGEDIAEESYEIMTDTEQKEDDTEDSDKLGTKERRRTIERKKRRIRIDSEDEENNENEKERKEKETKEKEKEEIQKEIIKEFEEYERMAKERKEE